MDTGTTTRSSPRFVRVNLVDWIRSSRNLMFPNTSRQYNHRLFYEYHSSTMICAVTRLPSFIGVHPSTLNSRPELLRDMGLIVRGCVVTRSTYVKFCQLALLTFVFTLFSKFVKLATLEMTGPDERFVNFARAPYSKFNVRRSSQGQSMIQQSMLGRTCGFLTMGVVATSSLLHPTAFSGKNSYHNKFISVYPLDVEFEHQLWGAAQVMGVEPHYVSTDEGAIAFGTTSEPIGSTREFVSTLVSNRLN